jgi:hypothetical protein
MGMFIPAWACSPTKSRPGMTQGDQKTKGKKPIRRGTNDREVIAYINGPDPIDLRSIHLVISDSFNLFYFPSIVHSSSCDWPHPHRRHQVVPGGSHHLRFMLPHRSPSRPIRSIDSIPVLPVFLNHTTRRHRRPSARHIAQLPLRHRVAVLFDKSSSGVRTRPPAVKHCRITRARNITSSRRDEPRSILYCVIGH